MRLLDKHFRINDPDLVTLRLLEDTGGVGGTKPGGRKSEQGAGPGEGAPPYWVPYLPGVGTLGLPGLSGVWGSSGVVSSLGLGEHLFSLIEKTPKKG